VNDDPVKLDEHRGLAAQRDTEFRRDIREVQVDQEALRGRQEELEGRLLAAPAATRAEAAASARYLIQLFAATPQAQDPRRQKLIARALDDLTRFAE
jgi:hypothetical protein